MAFFRRRAKANPQADLTEKEGAQREDFTLQWEFGDLDNGGEQSAAAFDNSFYTLRPTTTIDEISAEASHHRVRSFWSTSPPHQSWQQQRTDPNLEAVRTALDNALEQWWGDGTLPSKPLVRDGLLALEAGHDLDEGHRSLLLRAALVYGRGMVTALKHQTDGERTAFMIKEMLLDLRTSLAPDLIGRLREEDSKSGAWVSFLISELQYELQLVVGIQQQQVEQTLEYLQGTRRPKLASPLASSSTPQTASNVATQAALPASVQPYWSYGRLLVMALLALSVTVLLVMGWQSTSAAGAATIPGGLYIIRDLGQTQQRQVELTTFAIDRAEVTNREYQRCYHAGVCVAPDEQASATRENYFSVTAFADYPVVNVSWEEANQYCQWQGKQLPTAEQWQVAASIAPATQRTFRYPWGDQFDQNLANTQATGLLDTKPVGAYHPNGDSGFGVMDMAGNVAEWTTTKAEGNSNVYIVKGGSFQDQAEATATDAQQQLSSESRAPWLGFRCSVELPD